jgi:hypothetical protein
MAAIIYQKNPDALIPQGNRTVSTFPSGLVLVDQSFIGLTSLESTHRSQLQIRNAFPTGSDPTIDGLSIFPAIQEKRLPNGFTEYMVSAYGRTNTTGNSYLVPGLEFDSLFSFTLTATNEIGIRLGFFRGYDLITTRVIKENTFDEEVTTEIPLPDLLGYRGAPIGGNYSINNLNADLVVKVKDIKRSNFGVFTELTILKGYAQR